MADITMPQLGETVTEGTITKWMKAVGDRIEEDEILFEVSTDKVDSEVPSPTGGYVAEILVPEGETVDIGARLAVISDAPPSGAPAPAAQPAAALPAEPAPDVAETSPAPAGPAPAGAPSPAAPAAGSPSPQGHPPEPLPAPVPAAAPPGPPAAAAAPASAAPAAASGDGGGKVLSPVVRKLLNDNGIDASAITGTGSGGRITRNDVLSYLDQRGSKTSPAQPAAAPPEAGAEGARVAPVGDRPAAAGAVAPPVTGPVPGASGSGVGDEVVAFSNIRKRTAEHMVRSQITSAHTLVAFEVDYEGVEKVRGAAKDEFRAQEGMSLTFLPFIARAVVDAIREFPHVNASVEGESLIVHHRVHLGIAVDLNFEGLIVPVVHDADGKRLRGLAREFADLASRARAKKLGADDISGGTFTITNPGPFGTLLTVPIINQPQVAILSTDGVRKKPVAIVLPDGSDAIAVHPVGNLALSFDHRAYDGAYASAFLAKVKEILETRDWSQEL